MKSILTSIALSVLIIGGAYFLSQDNNGTNAGAISNVNNVTLDNGKQIIEIKVRGGYQPKISTAKAGVPTTLRFITENAFDCSASIRIQSLNIFKLLPQSGTTDIDLGTSTTANLQGTCGMGMYPFEVDFQS